MSTRIAIVCPIASGGGITEAFFNSLEMLQRQGATPIAIVPEQFSFLERLEATGLELHTVANLERGGTWNFLLQTVRLRQAIRRAKPDILVLNNGRHVAAQKRTNPDLPIVAIYHGGKPQRYAKADRVIAVNDALVRELITLGFPKECIAVVDNALPVDSLPPFPKRKKNLDFVAGTLCLMEHVKGLDLMIRALAALKSRGVMVRFLIAGQGPQEHALKQLAKSCAVEDQLDFVGWVSNTPDFLKKLDLYVAPSRSESWGLGIVEAFAAGLPVISTQTPGPVRVSGNGETAILVPTEDHHALATAIEKVVKDPKLADHLARAGYERCAERYLLPKVAPLFHSEVMQVLKTDPNGDTCFPRQMPTTRPET
ncbi:MAG: glycosyltransferase family 4 protein [Hyphomicrobiales bacterium]|jgi:glycosyltransferase involved in cell wall biosynthesis